MIRSEGLWSYVTRYTAGNIRNVITARRVNQAGKRSSRGGLVICELRTGELVVCELIVRTTDANLGYNANQKVQTFYAIKRGPYTCLGITQYKNDFHNESKRRKKPTQSHFTKKYNKATRVRCGGNYLHYTGPMYMRCLINELTRRKKTL